VSSGEYPGRFPYASTGFWHWLLIKRGGRPQARRRRTLPKPLPPWGNRKGGRERNRAVSPPGRASSAVGHVAPRLRPQPPLGIG
jgi:hypothetical protein